MTACSMPTCHKPSRSSRQPLCEMHYYRVRRNGTTDLKAREDYVTPARLGRPRRALRCSEEACDRPAALDAAPESLCTVHRAARDRQPAMREPKRTCQHPACDTLELDRSGWCSKHRARVLRHGDPDVVIHQSQRALPTGPSHPAWLEGDANYRAVHQRVRKAKGAATKHICVDCGGRAAHWSYDRRDDQERRDHHGPYSLELDHYEPRCVRCHKRFDMAAIAQEASR